MPPSTYHIEYAKSSRSQCKKCKEKIAKDVLRIVTSAYSETRDMDFVSNYHATCFQVPPRAMAGMSAEDFVEEHLVDKTTDEILDDEERKQEVIDGISVKPVKAKKAKKKRSAKAIKAEEEEEYSPDDKKVKAEMEAQFKEEEVAEEGTVDVQQQWVGCEKCEKWRKLPANVAPEDLPDVWYCSMNTWDVSLANCDAPEEAGADDDAECQTRGIEEEERRGKYGTAVVLCFEFEGRIQTIKLPIYLALDV